MEKNLKKLRQSKWLRCCFVLMSCVMVLISCIIPVFGYGVTLYKDSTLVPLLTGNVDIKFFSNSSTPVYGQDKNIVSVGLPTQYEYMTNGNTLYDFADYVEYFGKSVSGSPSDVRDYQLDIFAGRWAVDVNGQRYWRARTQIQSWQVDNPDNNAFFNHVTFNFDTFACTLDKRLINELFSVIAQDRVTIRSSATITYMSSEGKLETAGYSNSVDNYGGTRRYCAFFDDDAVQTFENWVEFNGLTVGQPVLISDFVVEVYGKKENSEAWNRSTLIFEVLTHRFYEAGNSKPEFWDPGNSVKWFINQTFDNLDYGSDNPIPPNYGGGSSTVEGNVWSQWLAGVVTGFFDAEIMPDFSFGKLFSVIMVVIFVLIALKFFGG